MLCCVIWYKLADVSDELTASIVMYLITTTRYNILEDSHVHIRRSENVK
jgi:hypothetical protein